MSEPTRQNRRPSIDVHLTIMNHPTYAAVFRDSALFGTVVKLWVKGASAWISRTGNVLTLPMNDAMWVTGVMNPGAASRMLERVCSEMSYPFLRIEGKGGIVFKIGVRNFARKQGFTLEGEDHWTFLEAAIKEREIAERNGRGTGEEGVRKGSEPPTRTRTTPGKPARVRQLFQNMRATDTEAEAESEPDSVSLRDTGGCAAVEPSGTRPTTPERTRLDQAIWGDGLAYLVSCGIPEKQARSEIGKLRKNYPEDQVAIALLEAKRQAVSAPIAWLEKRLAQYVVPRGTPRRFELHGGRIITVGERTKIDWREPEEGAINGRESPDGSRITLVRGQARFVG